MYLCIKDMKPKIYTVAIKSSCLWWNSETLEHFRRFSSFFAASRATLRATGLYGHTISHFRSIMSFIFAILIENIDEDGRPYPRFFSSWKYTVFTVSYLERNWKYTFFLDWVNNTGLPLVQRLVYYLPNETFEVETNVWNWKKNSVHLH